MVLLWFVISLIISLFLTKLAINFFLKINLVDDPSAAKRKIHRVPIPLGGGAAVAASMFVAVGWASFFGNFTNDSRLFLLVILVAVLMIIAGGLLDDKFSLSPLIQFIFPTLAAILTAFFLSPDTITNPFGGSLKFEILSGWPFWLGLILPIFLFSAWLLGMMYTTKFLDGLDGLVSGEAMIGAAVLYFLTRVDSWRNPEVGLLTAIFAGAMAGFWFFNRHPAKIFLGEGGSLLAGYMLGVLAILSGGKVMATLLVLGLPAFDVVRVLYSRLRRRQPLSKGDREHLHYRLLDAGFSHPETVRLFYAVSLLLGLWAVVLQKREIVFGFLILAVLILIAGFFLPKSRVD